MSPSLKKKKFCPHGFSSCFHESRENPVFKVSSRGATPSSNHFLKFQIKKLDEFSRHQNTAFKVVDWIPCFSYLLVLCKYVWEHFKGSQNGVGFNSVEHHQEAGTQRLRSKLVPEMMDCRLRKHHLSCWHAPDFQR